MRCLVTAGPTFEPLDDVRRLTNFSSGRLGTELANYLTDRGHRVTLLLGVQSTWPGPHRAQAVETFSTTDDLQEKLRARAKHKVDAIFHAAAVSDFAFGAIWRRSTSGALRRLRGGKLATRDGILLAELVPTPKVIACLRRWFPRAWLVGWKYEVDASRFRVLARARRQIVECATDACVANGPGYGQGFGLVLKDGQAIHLRSRPLLFSYLERAARSASRCRCSTP